MKVHELRTWPPFFEEVILRDKKFEVRKNDRDFQIGDVLVLREWQPDQTGDGGRYTGRIAAARVTSILSGPILGIAEGWCVMGVSVA